MTPEQMEWWDHMFHVATCSHIARGDAIWCPSRWPNFSPAEIACKGTGNMYVNAEAMDALQALRNVLGPLKTTSAYRSPQHNRSVGGSRHSMHQLGIAFDLIPQEATLLELVSAAEEQGWGGIGHYPAQGFVHVDRRPWTAHWTG